MILTKKKVLEEMALKITIKDIAEAAGVSTTTVSQILNNKGSRFSEETRAKVMETVKKFDYQPDFFAQNMITKKSKTIGMIVPDVTDFFFSKLIEGVEAYLNSFGYMMLLCNTSHSNLLEEKYFEELLRRSVEGIIIATPNMLSDTIIKHPKVRNKRVPLLLMDLGKNPRNEGKLLVEEYQGVYDATKYLIDNGHRKIAFLREVGDYYQLSERITGFLNCLEDCAIEADERLIESSPLDIPGGYQGTNRLLEKNIPFTALVCTNDQMAIGAYQAITEAGSKVPEDISVIGFDGLEITRYMSPALTTVYQPIYDVGYTAGEFIIGAIEKPASKIPNKTFPTKLLIRDSVKRLTD